MNEKQQEIDRLVEMCKPIVEYLGEKCPHYSITIDSEDIKVNQTVIGIPLAAVYPIHEYKSERKRN